MSNGLRFALTLLVVIVAVIVTVLILVALGLTQPWTALLYQAIGGGYALIGGAWYVRTSKY